LVSEVRVTPRRQDLGEEPARVCGTTTSESHFSSAAFGAGRSQPVQIGYCTVIQPWNRVVRPTGCVKNFRSSTRQSPRSERRAISFQGKLSGLTVLMCSADARFYRSMDPRLFAEWAHIDEHLRRAISAREHKPVESLTLDAEYYPFWTVRTRATWEVFQPLRAYVKYQWDSDYFYRADRGDKKDKLFYREMRAYAGMRFDLRHIGFEVTGGYAFNRFYFEGEGYQDRHDNRIAIGDAWFIVG
jgi:hypothetical protein